MPTTLDIFGQLSEDLPMEITSNREGTMTTSWTKLDDGTWGIRIQGSDYPAASWVSLPITITAKSGRKSTVIVGEHVKTFLLSGAGRVSSRTVDIFRVAEEPKQAASAPAAPAADVPAGRYAVEENGELHFFQVDRPTEGKWAGYTFLKIQASDDTYPIKERTRKAAILASIAADPQAASVRYGRELGVCGVCGRTLTDEASRAAGIGPVCAQQFGFSFSAPKAPSAPAEEAPAPKQVAPTPVAQQGPARKRIAVTDGKDKQGVALGYGDWRARKRIAKEILQAENGKRIIAQGIQMETLKGETWEDIFS